MDPHLSNLKQSLESAVKGMTSEEWSWHPTSKWCAAEVLEHLYLSYTGTIKGFERVMTSGKPLGSRPSMADRVKTLLVLGCGHMPGGLKAPAVAVPKGLPMEKVRAEFGAMIGELDAIITQCEVRFGRRVHVLDHPILGPLTAPQWRKLHVVHGRHHHKQLLRLRENATRQTA
jgi:hypothetical protein